MNTDKENHIKALQYWQKCSNSYLAAEEYYQRQEDALIEILKNVENCNRALDIGCGDGRYTLILKSVAYSVLGIDVAPILIQQAKDRLKDNFFEHVDFQISSIESIAIKHEYDLLACMGVTSGLIEETAFCKAIADMAKALKPQGKLIIKDTTALGESEINRVGDYVAIYRNSDLYLNTLNENGFTIEKEIELSRTEGGMINKIRLATYNEKKIEPAGTYKNLNTLSQT